MCPSLYPHTPISPGPIRDHFVCSDAEDLHVVISGFVYECPANVSKGWKDNLGRQGCTMTPEYAQTPGHQVLPLNPPLHDPPVSSQRAAMKPLSSTNFSVLLHQRGRGRE